MKNKKHNTTNVFSRLASLLALICACVMFSFSNAQNVKTYIPERAFENRDDLYDSIKKNLPDLYDYNFVPALIEHESCISLKHSRCWNANSTLSNSREHSVGYFQIAKAFNADGTTRMDTLQSLKNKYRDNLKELTWSNIARRPDLQLEAGTLLLKDNWNGLKSVTDPKERTYMLSAAHNGGLGRVQKDRRICGMDSDCDPQKWKGNVADKCSLSTTPMPKYGNRSLCQINRNHPIDVIETRMPKYDDQYFTKEYIKSREKG